MKTLVKLIYCIIIISLFSCKDPSNIHSSFGRLNSYQSGETYESQVLNEKFIALYNGNLDGKGLYPEHKDDKGQTVQAHPAYTLNITNLVNQFFNPETQPKLGTSLNTAYYNVNSYHILYNTPGVNYLSDGNDYKHTVSALVLIPNIPLEKIKGIVLYYHGTEFAKNSVPSCIPNKNFTHTSNTNYGYCYVNSDNFNSSYIIKLSLFAAQGYIVLAPDGIGLGSDNHTVHPYVVYPETNALTGIYGLSALNQLLQAKHLFTKLPLFITGYSEGAAYALKTSQLLQSNHYDSINNLYLTSTVPAEGAYDLSDTQINFEFDNVSDGLTNVKDQYKDYVNYQKDQFIKYNLDSQNHQTDSFSLTEYQKQNNPWSVGSALMASNAKPYLVSYTLVAYTYYSLYNFASSYDQLMKRSFWDNIKIQTPQGSKSINISNFYNNTSLTNQDILALITQARQQTNSGQFYNPNTDIKLNIFFMGDAIESNITIPKQSLELFGTGQNNSIAAFVHDNVKQLPLFKLAIENADTYKWKTNSPIHFVTNAYDSVVPVQNTKKAYEYMSALTPKLVTLNKINNFQFSNDAYQYLPSEDQTLSVNKYWAPLSDQIIDKIKQQLPDDIPIDLNILAMPIDHTQAEPVALVSALCAFEQDSGQQKSICRFV